MIPPDLDTVLARSTRIVGRRVADACVLVPLAGSAADIDSIYNLNAVGAFIWEKLDGRRSGHDVVRSLQATYAVDPERASTDYLEFVRDLCALGALQPAPL